MATAGLTVTGLTVTCGGFLGFASTLRAIGRTLNLGLSHELFLKGDTDPWAHSRAESLGFGILCNRAFCNARASHIGPLPEVARLHENLFCFWVYALRHLPVKARIVNVCAKKDKLFRSPEVPVVEGMSQDGYCRGIRPSTRVRLVRVLSCASHKKPKNRADCILTIAPQGLDDKGDSKGSCCGCTLLHEKLKRLNRKMVNQCTFENAESFVCRIRTVPLQCVKKVVLSGRAGRTAVA